MDDQSSGLLPIDPSRVVSSEGEAKSVAAAKIGEEQLQVCAPTEAPAVNSTTVVKLPLMISLHGIRTRGKWQKELSDTLSASFIYAPLDFGFFSALKLLRRKKRRERIDWFREEYTKLCRKHGDKTPCVIAHSLGSYIVARSMQIYPEIRFNRIILCGSIVDPAFPWSKLNENQFNRVLNDCGHADFWSRIVGWGVEDSGASGVKGFTDEAAGKVLQRRHAEFGHSDYFYDLNYEENWIPFLKGNDPPPLINPSAARVNWRFRLTSGSLTLSLLSVLAYFGWLWIASNRGNAPPPRVPPQNAPPIAAKEGLKDRKDLPQTMLRKQNPAIEANDRKSREGLTKPLLHVDAPKPLGILDDADFLEQWKTAKAAASASEMAALEKDINHRSVKDWACSFLKTLDESSENPSIKVTLGPAGQLTAWCFLAHGTDTAEFRHMKTGKQLKLTGTFAEIDRDGVRFTNCRIAH